MDNSSLSNAPVASGKQAQGFSQLHVLIPFQPSMWERNKVEKIMKSVISKANKMLTRNAVSQSVKSGVMQALQTSMRFLDLSTLRKTALISITENGANTLYLSGKIRKKFILNRPVTLADLASTEDTSPAFFILHLGKERAVLYEYHKHVLNTITERKNREDFSHYQMIDSFLNILQNFQSHAVFITGIPEFVLAYKAQTKMRELMIDVNMPEDFEGNIMASSLANEISSEWQNWKQKFYVGLLQYGERQSLVYYGSEEINSNIANCKRGIIFVEKDFGKKEDFTPERDEFFSRLHNFLSEGNYIFLTEDKHLKEKGGIALYKFPMKSFNITIPVKEEKILL